MTSAEFSVYIICVFVFILGVVSMLCLGEKIFDLLYRFVPPFRRWWDNFRKTLPNYDDEEVSD